MTAVWMQGAWQLGKWSARQLNSVTWAGAVSGGMYHNLYFGIYADTEEPITSSVMASSMQLHELAPSFLSSAAKLVSHPHLILRILTSSSPNLVTAC